MGRPDAQRTDELVAKAMDAFWRRGYAATSAADLVEATGVSRYGIYAAFSGKHALFLACLDAYQGRVVTPAFAALEAPGADLAALRRYFSIQLDKAEAIGLPGPGCLIANTAAELAAHDPAARARVEAHHKRLRRGFRNALGNMAARSRGARREAEAVSDAMREAELDDLAETLTVAAQGLWTMSRTVADAERLRRAADALLALIQRRLGA